MSELELQQQAANQISGLIAVAIFFVVFILWSTEFEIWSKLDKWLVKKMDQWLEQLRQQEENNE